MDEEKTVVYPTIAIPHRLFLIGAIYGFNAGRKQEAEINDSVIQPMHDGHEATNEDFYFGSWLEAECIKCIRHYTFEGPNDIPENNLVCDTDGCGNHVIAYGLTDPKEWKIGFIRFE